MIEDARIFIFSSKLTDIPNKAYQHSEHYSEEKLVRKTLRSLPSRFSAEVAIIKEARDVTTLKFDDLMESLQIYEMDLTSQNRQRHGSKGGNRCS